MIRNFCRIATIAWLAVVASPLAHAQTEQLIAELLGGGYIGLMRHARAPGSDDPPEFRLDDCATQRNLSASGRDQAAAIGRFLRERGLTSARVVSSQWCRCQDTAQLLDLGPVEDLPSLNSLVSYPRRSAEMTAATHAWILEQDLSRPTILVTHQINIGALVREYPNEGQIVVVQPSADGSLEVVGTIDAVAPPR